MTPLTEVGLLPIGSRPAKRGLGAKSLDDLRTIPWIFSWSQARINLAAWYGLGTACEQLGDLDQLKAAYQEWPFFRTFIDNIEMSIAKTDQRIAKMYLHLAIARICPRRSSPRCSSRVSGSLPSSVMSGRCSVAACSVAPSACATLRRRPVHRPGPRLREVRMNQDEMAEEKKAEYMSLILRL